MGDCQTSGKGGSPTETEVYGEEDLWGIDWARCRNGVVECAGIFFGRTSEKNFVHDAGKSFPEKILNFKKNLL